MNKTNKKIIQSTIIIGIIVALIWIVSAEFGETNVEFSLANAQHSCQSNAEGDVSYWVWWDGSKVIKNEVGFPFPPKFSCYRPRGWPSNGCCPLGIQCNVVDCQNPGFEGQCYKAAPPVCSDYNEYCDPEAFCKAFDPLTAIRSVEQFTETPGICSGDYSVPKIIDGQRCDQYTSNCRCYWEDGECKSTSTAYTFCDDGNNYEGNCTQTTVNKSDDCIEKGLITYVWTALWNMTGIPPTSHPTQTQINDTRPTYCKDGIKTFSCNMIKLSVFTFMNVVLFILIVVIIYYYKIVRGRILLTSQPLLIDKKKNKHKR